jgi:predicted nuclease of predicted toxin-antitoxin system
MRILLDESLPHKLKQSFPDDHEVSTTRDMGWLGQKNGALLKLMAESSFELFVTVDRNLPSAEH